MKVLAVIGLREALAAVGVVALNVGLVGYDWRIAAIVTGSGILASVAVSLMVRR